MEGSVKTAMQSVAVAVAASVLVSVSVWFCSRPSRLSFGDHRGKKIQREKEERSEDVKGL
jgi:hypothetical protein